MNRILIISASSRAMAESAERAGFSFDVYDQFQDWDLQQICQRSPANQNQILAATDFESLVKSIDGARYLGAVVGGGFENRLTELEFLGTRITRFGPNLETLRSFQSPDSLTELRDCTLMAGGKWPTTIPCLHDNLLCSENQSRTETSWLIKDLRGSGGSHVRRLERNGKEKTDSHSDGSNSFIFQERISGNSISALYLSVDSKSNPKILNEDLTNCFQLIGCTEQLVGVTEFGASEFSYCGSVGPIFMREEQQQIIWQIGRKIAEKFSISGIFGIDFIVNHEGIWPVDINPRITASAELFERHRQINGTPPFSFFMSHIEACTGKRQTIESDSNGLTALAKGILFCPDKSGLKINQQVFDYLVSFADPDFPRPHRSVRPSLFIADVPDRDTTIPHGAPILTLFETGSTPEEAKRNLFDSATSLMLVLSGA